MGCPKVTLFYTCSDKEYHQSGTPMGLAYLAGALAQQQHVDEIEIAVDVNAVFKSKPDIVGISSYSGLYSQSIAIAKKIKRQLDIPIVIGGTHITALPESLDPVFDAGVLSEGENTFAELVGLLKNHQWSPESLQQVPGIVFHHQGQLHYTASRALEMELDNLAFPQRSVLNTYWPSQQTRHYWPQVLFTARGCPYRCMFCIHSGARQKVRYHSPERVIAEIYDILRLNPQQKTISIFDDLFAIHKRRLEEIVRLIRAEKLHQRVSFISHAKSSCFDADIARLLKLMNSSMVIFGFESASDRIVKYLKGKESSAAKNQQALELCRQFNLPIGGYFIIGTPIETYAELAQTYWFIRRNTPPLRASGSFFLTPLPGTVYWDESVAAGRVSPQMPDWSILDFTDLDKWQHQHFINPNYTFAELLKANEQFEELRQINYQMPMLEAWSQLRQRYREQLYTALAACLPPTGQVLEVAEDIDHWGQQLKDHDSPLAQRVQSVLNPNADEIAQADMILLNHVCEWQKDPLAFVGQFKEKSAVILACFNGAYAGVLYQLLTGTFHSWNNPALQLHQRLLSWPSVQALLRQAGFAIQTMLPLAEQGAPPPQLSKWMDEIQSHYPLSPDVLAHLGTFAFLVVATPIPVANATHSAA